MNCEQQMDSKINSNDQNENQKIEKLKESLLLLKKKMCRSHELIQQYDDKLKECERIKVELDAAKDKTKKITHEYHLTLGNFVKIELQNAEYKKDIDTLRKTIEDCETKMAGDKRHVQQLMCKVEDIEDKHSEKLMQLELTKAALEAKNKELEQELKVLKKTHELELKKIEKKRSCEIAKGKKNCSQHAEIEVKSTRDTAVNTSVDLPSAKPNKPETSEKSVLTDEFYSLQDDPYPLFCYQCKAKLDPSPLERICKVVTCPLLVTQTPSPPESPELSRMKPQVEDIQLPAANHARITGTVEEFSEGFISPCTPIDIPVDVKIADSPIVKTLQKKVEKLERKSFVLFRQLKRKEKLRDNYRSNQIPPNYYPPNPFHAPLQLDLMTEFWRRIFECDSNERRSMLRSRGRQVKRMRGKRIVSGKKKRTENGVPSSWLIESTESSQEMDVSFEEQPKFTDYTADDPPDNDALSGSSRCTTNGCISASEYSEERHEEKIGTRTSTPENSSIEDYGKIKDDIKVTFSRETCETVESGISPADESNETTNLVESKGTAFLSKKHEAAKTLQSPSNQLAISRTSSRRGTRPTLLTKLRSLKRNSKKSPSDCTTFGTTARCSREKSTEASAVSRKVTRQNSRINKVTVQNASHLDDEYNTNIPLKKQRIAHIPRTITELEPVFLKTKSISKVNDSCPTAGEKIWEMNTCAKEKLGIRKNSDLKDDVKLSQDLKKDEKNTILTLANETEPYLSIFSNVCEADVHEFSTVAKDRPHSRTTDRSNENVPEQDRNTESSEYSGSSDNQTTIASTSQVQDSQKFATSEEERLNSRQTIKPREGDVSCIQDSSSSDDGCAPMLINEARDEDRESREELGCSDDEITPTLTNEISDAQNQLLPNLLEERHPTEENDDESTSHTRDSKNFISEKKLKLVKEIEDLFGVNSKSSSRFIDKTREFSTYRKTRHDSLKEENLAVDSETILRTQVSKESESEIKRTSVKHEITPTLTNEIRDAQNQSLPNLLEERRSIEENDDESTSHTRDSKNFISEKKLKLVKEIEDLFGVNSKSSSRFIDKTRELSTYRTTRHDSLKEENLAVDGETIWRTQVSKESESEIKRTSVKHEITPTLTNAAISDAQNQLLPNLLEEGRSTVENDDESTSHTRDSKTFISEKKLKLVKEIEDLFGVNSKSSSRFIDNTRELSTYRKRRHDSLKEENLAVDNETILRTQVSKESENEIEPATVNDIHDLSKENSNQRANVEYCYAPFANEGIRDGNLKVASEEKVLTMDCSIGRNCDDNFDSDTTEIITYMQMEEIVSSNSSARYSTFHDLPPQEETQLNVTFDPFSLESPMSPPLMCSQPFANSDQESTFSEKSEQRDAHRDEIEVEEHGEAPDEIATRRGVKRKLPTDEGSECTSPVKELRSRTILIGEEKNDAVKSADAEIARSSETDRTLKEKSKKNVNVERDAFSPATLLAEYLKRKEAATVHRTKATRNYILKMKQKQEAIITAQVTRLLDSEAWTSDVHWSVIEEVCKDSDIKTHTIAKCVVNLLCERSKIEEPLDRTYTPPAPLMNKTQQRLVAMLVSLETKRSTMIQLVQAGIEHKLFRLGRAPDVPVLQGLARMFTVLARIKKDREKVRIMCCDALYCLSLKALPLIYVVLTCWPEVFPMSGSNEEVLPKCMIHSIMMQPMSGKIFKQLPLKSLLTIYYKYASSGYSSKTLLTDLMTAVQERHSCSVNTAVILLAKKEGTAWTYTNIVREGLMKLIVENNCPSKYDAFYLLGNVMRSFPVRDEDGTVAEIITQLSDLINSGQGSQDQQEGVASALLSLSRHKSTKVAKSIMKWKPGVALRSTTATQLEAFFNNHPVSWWRKFIKLSLSEFSEDK